MTKKQRRVEREWFEVDSIYDRRVNPHTLMLEYRVHWVGYDSSQDSWEIRSNLEENCLAMLQCIDKKLGRQVGTSDGAQSHFRDRMEDVMAQSDGVYPFPNSGAAKLDDSGQEIDCLQKDGSKVSVILKDGTKHTLSAYRMVHPEALIEYLLRHAVLIHHKSAV
jgi:hypothetical protein